MGTVSPRLPRAWPVSPGPWAACCPSVAKSCPLWDLMDCSMPGFPVHHHLLEFAQTHVASVSDAIQPSHLLSPSCLQSFPASRSFPVSQFFESGGQSIGASTVASVLSKNIQDLFPVGLTGLILQSKGLSRVFSSTTVQKHQFFGIQSSLSFNSHSRTQHWKNHSFDYMDLCWQSHVSAF